MATTCSISAGCSRPAPSTSSGRRDAVRRDHRVPPRRERSARRGRCRSRPTAPVAARPPGLRLPAFRHLEYFHDHDRIEHMFFDGAPTPVGGSAAARPVPARPGPGVQATGRRTLRRLRTEHRTGERLDGHRQPTRRRRPRHRKRGSRTPLHRRLGPRRPSSAQAIRGEVRFDAGSRALYATDGSNYRQVPIGVVIPTDVDDVIETVAVCRRHGAPILSRGGGTSLTGGCCNVAVVMDWSKHLNKVLSIDPSTQAGAGAAGHRARRPPHRRPRSTT